MYYAHVDSKNVYHQIDRSKLSVDSYGSENVQNIEVTEEMFNLAIEKGMNYYTYSNGEIILNPNYEQEELEKRNQERNQEIDEKVKELSEMATVEMIKNNKENVDTYCSIINSLIECKS